MKSKRTHALHANMSTLVRNDTVDGVEFVVCPAILINEGVHNNVYYPAGELSRHTDAWNGRPVVLGHPTANGKPVTANSKKVKESSELGMLLNAFWDENLKALKADVYLDKAKCKTRAPRVLEKLEANEGMDVSTGLFTDDEFKANSFNEKDYECVARNHRPDHLAVLPDGRGACSWEDGAGLPRVNEEDEDDDNPDDVCDECGSRLEEGKCPRCDADSHKQNSSLFSRFCEFLGLSKEDAARTAEPKLNEVSFNERIQKITAAVTDKYRPAAKEWGVYAQYPGPSPWVQDVYETWCVFQLGDKKFRVDYEWDEDLETVELTSEPEEVVQKQVYSKAEPPKANGGSGKEAGKRIEPNNFLDPRGSEQPPVWAQQEGSPSMDKLMKVNSLIQSGALDSNLRETMLAAPDAVVMAFDQLATKAQRPKTLEEMAEELSPEEKKKLEEMKAAKKAKDEEDGKEKKELIANIKSNAANKYSDADLDTMSVPWLRTLSTMLPTGASNHSPAAGATTPPKANESQDEVPDMPSLDDVIKANSSK